MKQLKPRKRKTKEFKDGGGVTSGKARFRMDRPSARRRADGGSVEDDRSMAPIPGYKEDVQPDDNIVASIPGYRQR
jgi:hypothetical protein